MLKSHRKWHQRVVVAVLSQCDKGMVTIPAGLGHNDGQREYHENTWLTLVRFIDSMLEAIEAASAGSWPQH